MIRRVDCQQNEDIPCADDAIPKGSVSLIDAFHRVIESVSDDWLDQALRHAGAVAEDLVERRHLPDDARHDWELLLETRRRTSNYTLRWALETAQLVACVRDPETGDVLQLDSEGWVDWDDDVPALLEFFDLKEFTKELLSPNEASLLSQAGWIRNKVAHFDLIDPEVVSRFSDFYEATIGDVDFDIPGWNWPRCGQSMTLTVGPSGAGKSTWSAAQGIDVISSDDIRKERSPNGEVRGAQSDIFHEVRMRSAKVLSNGRSVIVDAMHIEPDDRLRQLAIAPADVQKRYALIDRPLADKQRDGGWRGQKGLVDRYHRLFADHAGAALAGDGRADIEVVDLRTQDGEGRTR